MIKVYGRICGMGNMRFKCGNSVSSFGQSLLEEFEIRTEHKICKQAKEFSFEWMRTRGLNRIYLLHNAFIDRNAWVNKSV
jgi:hypothetical protein